MLDQRSTRTLLNLSSAALIGVALMLTGCTRSEDRAAETNQAQDQDSLSGTTQSIKDRATQAEGDARKGLESGRDQVSNAMKDQSAANQPSSPSSIDISQLKNDKGAVRQIQEALKSKGYDPGKVDGAWGPNTQSALNNFEKDKNLPMNASQIDGQVIRELGVDLSSSSATTRSQ